MSWMVLAPQLAQEKVLLLNLILVLQQNILHCAIIICSSSDSWHVPDGLNKLLAFAAITVGL